MSEKEKPEEEAMESEVDPITDIEAEPADEVEVLRVELKVAQEGADENMDGWQRSQAEFANYKKRVARDQQQLYIETRGRVIKRYLEIADDLERALSNRPEDGAGAEWANGVELIYRKLLSYLEGEGVSQMQVMGQEFDPNLHEAISQEESEKHKSGEIIEVLQPGYMLGERVLRPAVVKVAQ